jgi:hypothetical protein
VEQRKIPGRNQQRADGRPQAGTLGTLVVIGELGILVA